MAGALSTQTTYALLRAIGYTPSAAITQTAIGLAESGLNPGAVGDTSLETPTWGPSLGMFQERTLKAQTGTGGTRDANALAGNPVAQAKAAYQTSGGGTNFNAWTMYTNGTYRQYLGQVAQAVDASGTAPLSAAQLAALNTSSSGSGTGVQPAGFSWTNPLGSVTSGLKNVMVPLMFAAAGAGLVVIGITKAASPSVRSAKGAAGQVVQQVPKAAEAAAVV